MCHLQNSSPQIFSFNYRHAFSFYFLFAIYGIRKTSCFVAGESVSLLFLIFWGSLIVGSYQGQNFLYALKQLSMLYLIWGFYYYLRLYNIKVEFLFALFRYMFIGYLLITVICYILFPHFYLECHHTTMQLNTCYQRQTTEAL